MKKKLINKLLVGALIVSSALPLASNVPVHAAMQLKDKLACENGTWRYYDKNGLIGKNVTITRDGEEFKFDENGNLIKSEEDLKDDKKMDEYKAKYPHTNECSEDYKKRDDRWTNKDGNWYFNWKFPGVHEEDCQDKDCWDEINGYWYHFNKDGVMDKNTTVKDELGNDCVVNSDGVLTNREKPEFDNSFIDSNKYTKQTINGNIYFINSKGEKATGWIQDSDNKWYFMNKDGVVQKDTTIIDGDKKYVVGSDGAWIQ